MVKCLFLAAVLIFTASDFTVKCYRPSIDRTVRFRSFRSGPRKFQPLFDSKPDDTGKLAPIPSEQAPAKQGFGKNSKPKKSLKSQKISAVQELEDESPEPLTPVTKADGSQGVKIPGADKYTLVYTCKVCDTRQLCKIHKIAYNSGIVIVTCKGCKNRHLIADPGGLLDTPDFKNIQQYLEAKGEKVLTPHISDTSQLRDFNLQENPETGMLELVPKTLLSELESSPPPEDDSGK
mmetsp:Transcript_10802/g.16745  ORF Transcript_10802/g.16745 Transcript_10802/m.16745 type:complete len:235 (+) Transcript_10802:142-846(+)